MISKLSWHSSHTLAPGEVAVICLRFETFNDSDTDNIYNACCLSQAVMGRSTGWFSRKEGEAY